ncbi:hypothetical protein ABI59_23810 [Acidobacteria bacterium Mor1]|nr:hypothetical protein ABI59_23810 [Acidobacteria bacterium Mor1]
MSSSTSLDAIFRPRSVAVIGASRRQQTIGYEILHNLIGYAFTGPVYPVNPGSDVVHSIRAAASIEDIEGPVDLAVIVVPRDHVLGVVEACARKGVRGIVTITAGFKEVDEQGAELEAKVVDVLERNGMRMVGPNCMGVINTEPDVRLNATFAAEMPERGNVGIVSQSGALGEAILADAQQSGIGVAMFVSMGNKADISGNDLLEYWEDNDDIQVILMYLESFGNPSKFTRYARKVTRKKPVITVKAGRTAAGARAASSHTGSIVGLDIASSSLLEQCGVLRVSSMEEMFVQASALASQPVAAGDRIAVVTNAGGPGILCTDALVGRGLTLAELSEDTKAAMRAALPPEASVVNPVDMIASADATHYRAVLEAVKADPGVDGIIAIFVSPIMIDAFEVARAIADASTGEKPVLSVFMGKRRSDEGIQKLRESSVPIYRFPEEAASGMSALVRYRQLRDRPHGESRSFEVDRDRAAAAIAAARSSGRLDLSSFEVGEILAAYGFPVAPARQAGSLAEAIAAAQELGYPVVVKVDSESISHKSDVGGVRVDLRNADEVGAAYREITDAVKDQDPDAGVLVQRLIRGGREVILGMARDGVFGPVLMFGLGGVFVEVMKDVAVRVHPLTDAGAHDMVRRVKGFPLLAGARGDKPVAIPLIEESLLRLSQLVADFEGELEELDLNPFIVTENPEDSFVVDARMRLRDADARDED